MAFVYVRCPICLHCVMVKRPGRGVDHPPLSSVEVEARVVLYLYSPLGLRGLFYVELYLYDATEQEHLLACVHLFRVRFIRRNSYWHLYSLEEHVLCVSLNTIEQLS